MLAGLLSSPGSKNLQDPLPIAAAAHSMDVHDIARLPTGQAGTDVEGAPKAEPQAHDKLIGAEVQAQGRAGLQA
jgi:hypothetical protein